MGPMVSVALARPLPAAWVCFHRSHLIAGPVDLVALVSTTRAQLWHQAQQLCGELCSRQLLRMVVSMEPWPPGAVASGLLEISQGAFQGSALLPGEVPFGELRRRSGTMSWRRRYVFCGAY